MWLQFFAQNGHFAINLIAALASLGVCWLYLDAWQNKHSSKELAKWVGFGLLGMSFIVQATIIEQSVLGTSVLGNKAEVVVLVLRLLAYAAIIVGQLIDPLMEIPKNTGMVLEEETASDKDKADDTANEKNKKAATLLAGPLSVTASALLPLGALGIAYLYFRRATTGLERHLKPLAYGFAAIAASDAIHMLGFLRTTTNPTLLSLVQSFSWVWMLEQVALLVGAVIIGRWVWSYLTKRFFSQLYMIFTLSIVLVFLVVSIGFTSLLLREIRRNSLVNLETSSHVLSYALDARQAETSSGAAQVAGNVAIANAVLAKDQAKLKDLTKTYLVEKKQSGLIITTVDGQVLLRAEDTEQWGDSLSNDPLVRRALLGISKSGISSVNTGMTPSMAVRSAVPIKGQDGTVIGSVVASLELGPAFVDGIKQSTGLQSAIYAQNTLSASTFLNPDGKTRAIGSKLSESSIKKTVLEDGKPYNGTATLQGKQLLVSFLPIKDADNEVIGMTMVGTPQSSILRSAGRSVELTFLLVAALIILSIVPIYLISRNLAGQIQ